MSLATALAGLSEAFMLASAVAVVAGWRAIRRQRVQTHRAWMLSAAALGGAFFVSYALRSLLIGDTAFGGPHRWLTPYLTFLQVHVGLATLAGVLGVITLRRALRARFAQHKRIAPWTAVLWLIAAGSGLVVFLLLYVVFQPGATVNVLRAIGGP